MADANLPSNKNEGRNDYGDENADNGTRTKNTERVRNRPEYVLRRLRNIERNNRRLANLGLLRNSDNIGRDCSRTQLNCSSSAAHKIKNKKRRTIVVTRDDDSGAIKRTRVSARIQDKEEQKREKEKVELVLDEKELKHVNGYYEINEILDRRVRQIKMDPERRVVEYCVSWKGCKDPPSWLIAENLDQNSLAFAFRQFPVPADPERNKFANNDKANDTPKVLIKSVTTQE